MSLTIATLSVSGGGRIGICGLPGLSGNLDGDLAAIVGWNPAIVVSMTEAGEMEALGSDNSGDLLRQAGIGRAHFPVPDFGIPATEEDEKWPMLSGRLHRLLDGGGGVLLHCLGGRGRSGMVALRLMVERGEYPDSALLRLRAERPGAVETDAQRRWAVGRAGKNFN